MLGRSRKRADRTRSHLPLLANRNRIKHSINIISNTPSSYTKYSAMVTYPFLEKNHDVMVRGGAA
jgi:hypothetical protein